MDHIDDETGYQIPPDAEVYVHQIRQRVEALVQSTIWEGLRVPDVDAWLNNFRYGHEQFFAAMLLDHLVYRSQEQINALIDQLFSREIPGAPDCHTPTVAPTIDLIANLRSSRNPRTHLIPVIKADDPPTKSGPYVLRMIQRHLNLQERWMLWPDSIDSMSKPEKRTWIFCDDFLGTGTQFKKFASAYSLDMLFAQGNCIYAPLAAHERGIAELNRVYPELSVTCAEQLTSDDDVFSESSSCFRDGINSMHVAKHFYGTILRRIAPQSRSHEPFTYGYGHLGLAYGFAHATPNSSIPLLWLPYRNYYPLLKR